MPEQTVVHRKGFALLAVLWVIVGLAALLLAAALLSRDAVAAATNRSDAMRAYWRAEDCLSRARVAIEELTTADAAADRTTHVWTALDTLVSRSPLIASVDCELTLHPVGTVLDVNQADRETLVRLFSALRASAPEALADAVLDWRDADHVPRSLGAERSWYAEQGRHAPRDGAFADVRELTRVKGLETLDGGLESLVGVESGRVVLTRAPLAVLAALPGMSQEALVRIRELRSAGRAWTLEELSALLSRAGRDSLMAGYDELGRLATNVPDVWMLQSRAESGSRGLSVSIRVRLARSGRRLVVARRQVVR